MWFRYVKLSTFLSLGFFRYFVSVLLNLNLLNVDWFVLYTMLLIHEIYSYWFLLQFATSQISIYSECVTKLDDWLCCFDKRTTKYLIVMEIAQGHFNSHHGPCLTSGIQGPSMFGLFSSSFEIPVTSWITGKYSNILIVLFFLPMKLPVKFYNDTLKIHGRWTHEKIYHHVILRKGKINYVYSVNRNIWSTNLLSLNLMKAYTRLLYKPGKVKSRLIEFENSASWS